MRSLGCLSDFAKSRLDDRLTLQINYLNVLLLLSCCSSVRRGATSVVKIGRNKAKGKNFAIKEITKSVSERQMHLVFFDI